MKIQKLLGAGLALATVVGITFPQAQAQVYSTNEIIVSPVEVQTSAALPQIDMASSGQELYLSNFSPNDVTFSVPQLDVSYVVPANSERVVYIDAATIAAADLDYGDQISYEILDESGNRLASGFMVNQGEIASTITTMEVVQETTTTTTESATTQPVTESRSTVRGFW